MVQTTRQTELDKLSASLSSIYEPREALSIAQWLLEALFDWQKIDFFIYGYEPIEIDDTKLKEATAQLLEGKPLQYITGIAPFYGLELDVKGATLIPRAETEELVRWIIKEKHEGKLLDIGTGSGAIAIALAQNERFEVEAVDVSSEALVEARANAVKNEAKVEFSKIDILSSETDALSSDNYDVIVSNPPYIPASELSNMHQNVVDFEPHLALFVPDEDPLLFYREIAVLAKRILKNKGWLYFEIHENFASETFELLSGLGFGNIELREDINGKNRMVRCQNKRP